MSISIVAAVSAAGEVFLAVILAFAFFFFASVLSHARKCYVIWGSAVALNYYRIPLYSPNHRRRYSANLYARLVECDVLPVDSCDRLWMIDEDSSLSLYF